LASFKPMHILYETTAVIENVRDAQENGSVVAVYPSRKFIDQFQFSGRLTKPLVPKQSLHEIAVWANEHPNQYCLLFFEKNNYMLLGGNGIIRQFKDGWLIFRSSNGLLQDYQALELSENQVIAH
jgi:hypothetical protein